MINELTKKQRETLEFIREFTREAGYPPTRLEIGRRFEIWPNAAQDRLNAMVKKNAIVIDIATARGIRIV
jgi:SOS-response transcriptional repressor LexA